jgi:hypothetical protein
MGKKWIRALCELYCALFYLALNFNPSSSRSSWLSFHRSCESIRIVCDAEYRADARCRRAICPAFRRDLACL